MAAIYKRKDSKGRVVGWRAVVRFDGRPAICKQHARKEEAQDWANEIERQIKQGQFNFELYKNKHTFNELVERYRNDGALEHICSVEDVIRHLEYWTSRFVSYALIDLTSELIGKERRLLAEKPTNKGKQRSNSTVNRYIASLSALLRHAVKLKWISENPCFSLSKLKENPGRDVSLHKMKLHVS